MFDFVLGKEQLALRDEVRDFVRQVPRQTILDMDRDLVRFPKEFLRPRSSELPTQHHRRTSERWRGRRPRDRTARAARTRRRLLAHRLHEGLRRWRGGRGRLRTGSARPFSGKRESGRSGQSSIAATSRAPSYTRWCAATSPAFSPRRPTGAGSLASSSDFARDLGAAQRDRARRHPLAARPPYRPGPPGPGKLPGTAGDPSDRRRRERERRPVGSGDVPPGAGQHHRRPAEDRLEDLRRGEEGGCKSLLVCSSDRAVSHTAQRASRS